MYLLAECRWPATAGLSVGQTVMSAHTKRILLRIALIATTPFLLFTGLWCLFFFNTVNPMQIMFITDFEVENRTLQPVWVTPIGTFRSGGKTVLPQFSAPFPAIPTWRSRDLGIAPGERRRIYYDWDDINFSEIVIRDSVGVLRNLVVDHRPPTDAYYANKADLYRIDNLLVLPMATPVVAAALAPSPRRFIFWTFAIAGLVAPFPFVWLRRRLRESTPTLNTVLAQCQPTTPGG